MVADLGPTSFTVPGPFAAGETTMTLADGAPVEVWYPAPRASTLGQVEATYNLATWLPPALARLLPAGFSVTRATGAYRGLPSAPGRFPLVVFAHGFSGYRDQSTFLTSWLATWGFVVAAPDLLDDDLTAVLSGQDTTSLGADLGELEATITLVGQAGGGRACWPGMSTTPRWRPSATRSGARPPRSWPRSIPGSPPSSAWPAPRWAGSPAR